MKKMVTSLDSRGILSMNFKNLQELYSFLENNPVKGKCPEFDYFHGGTRFTHHFNGFSSLNELREMSRVGTDKHTANIMKNKIKVDSPIKVEKIISERRNSYCGGRVSVPRYLDGRPDCMIKNKRSPVRSNILRIAVCVSSNSDSNKQYMIDIGSELINILQTIEKSGYKIEIYSGIVTATFSSHLSPQVKEFYKFKRSEWWKYYVVAMTRVKRDNEPFNIRKIAYPLVEPAFFRGQHFQLLANHIDDSGLGYTPSGEETIKVITKVFGKDVIPIAYDEMIYMSKEERKGYILDKIRNHCVVL